MYDLSNTDSCMFVGEEEYAIWRRGQWKEIGLFSLDNGREDLRDKIAASTMKE